MKRVLNSGYVKLLSIDPKSPFVSPMGVGVVYEFELKVPLLILQTFHRAQKGTLTVFDSVDASEVYLPPFFFKGSPSNVIQMGDKECNELHTKYSNFYRNVINFYFKLLDQGVCLNQAQLVLPLGLFTVVKWTVHVTDLKHFIEENKNVSPELVGYCEVFSQYLEETTGNLL